MEYREYLKSDHWRQFRKQMIHRAGYVCSRCGYKPKDPFTLNVHHKTYERLGQEDPGDVLVLCYKCHMKEHDALHRARQRMYKPLTGKSKSVLTKFIKQ